MPQSSAKNVLTLALFSTALFISAAAMFMLQLMVGKMLLPLTGGTPAGWIIALSFFQLALLAGYALAFWLSRFPPRIHGAVFLAALAAGAACLPVVFPRDVTGEVDALFVFRLLAVTVAIPSIALSATSSTLQRLFASTRHASASDPYFLYAASNLGSMAGLLLYPVVVETTLALTEQSRLWFLSYGLLAALGAACMFVSGKVEEPVAGEAKPITWKKRAEWAMLAFFPSSLLLGVTMHITTAIIAAPLIWVLPMALYLLTYVLAFSRPSFLSRGGEPEKAAAAVIPLALAILILVSFKIPWEACWHLMILTIIAFLYHVRLAQARPEKQRLSEFYLMIALGGALGGILNALIAPLVFSQLFEYPLIAVLACVAHPALRPYFRRQHAFFWGAVLVLGLVGARMFYQDVMGQKDAIFLTIFLFTAFFPRAVLVPAVIFVFLYNFYRPQIEINIPDLELRMAHRSFFGVSRVYDEKVTMGRDPQTVRVLEHGTTTHGLQFLTSGYETLTTSYYSDSGPLGDIFTAYSPRKIAVIGLGTGNIACYGTPDRQFTFFEIDPAVIDIAQKWFTYLKNCQGARPPYPVEGDGRLELAKMNEKFDLIILDAFSSDMVPSHLLTKEAIDMYFRHLEKGGLLAFHITNRYLRIEKLLAASSADMGLDFRWKENMTPESPRSMASTWAAIAPPGELAQIENFTGWEKMAAPPGIRPWTDDYSSVLSILDRE